MTVPLALFADFFCFLILRGCCFWSSFASFFCLSSSSSFSVYENRLWMRSIYLTGDKCIRHQYRELESSLLFRRVFLHYTVKYWFSYYIIVKDQESQHNWQQVRHWYPPVVLGLSWISLISEKCIQLHFNSMKQSPSTEAKSHSASQVPHIL